MAVYESIEKGQYIPILLSECRVPESSLTQGLLAAGSAMGYRRILADRLHSLSRNGVTLFKPVHSFFLRAPQADWNCEVAEPRNTWVTERRTNILHTAYSQRAWMSASKLKHQAIDLVVLHESHQSCLNC